MQFHETRAGKLFFESQLPKLISALTDISASLKNRGTAYIIKPEIPEDFLTDLYYGNYDPSGCPNTDMENELTPEMIAVQQHIRGSVDQEVWEWIERYRSLLDGCHAAEREQAFAAGFRSAMTMLAAGLSQPITAGKE